MVRYELGQADIDRISNPSRFSNNSVKRKSISMSNLSGPLLFDDNEEDLGNEGQRAGLVSGGRTLENRDFIQENAKQNDKK